MTSPNVTQEMIDAYYEYTHLTLDRSKFVSKLRAMTDQDNAYRFDNPFEYGADRHVEDEVKLTQ